MKTRKTKQTNHKSSPQHKFCIEFTVYGWAVSEDGVRIGLFINKDAAMDRVKIRAQTLKALGHRWTVIVVGTEPAPYRGRYLPSRR